MRNIAIILAGGIGSRVGGETPKQLLPLGDGRTVLEHSVDAFERAACIDEIAIVMHPDWMDEAKTLCEQNNWQKVTQIIPGGEERWESSWHAILAYANDQTLTSNLSPLTSLWFHDAARPFVSERILSDVSKALEEHEAVTVAVPVTDTLYKVNREELIVNSIPNRAEFMRAQTPQAFHYEVVFEAYAKAIADDQLVVTDDVGIVRKYAPNCKVHVVLGEESNRKITYKEDLEN